MARPVANAHAVATAERLLQAAEQRFAAGGFAATRLEDIARDAAIRRSSLLYHYGSKEQLYQAVLERAFADLSEALTVAMADAGPFAERLDAVEVAFLAFLDRRPAFAALLLRDLLDGQGPARDLVLARVVPLIDGVEQLLRSAGKGALRDGLPVRHMLLQVAAATLVRAASGSLREPLWGPHARTPLSRRLFLKG